MRIRILGSAAGGGLPQWNCRCANCSAVRAGSPDMPPQTQSSLAVSGNGRAWFLLNVSPDVRQQILAFPALIGPGGEGGLRGTAIAGCILTDAELDHTAGLLLLREQGGFRIFCTATVSRWLSRDFPVRKILASFHDPAWSELSLDTSRELPSPDGAPSGLQLRAFEVDRHIPRYVAEDEGGAVGAVIGLEIQDLRTGGRLVYAPCLPALSASLRTAAAQADCVLIDGTFWSDDEPIEHGIGSRTARQMGHLPVSGPDGSLSWLGELKARRRAYLHINNTNPMLNPRGPEHGLVRSRGVRQASDGDEFTV